MSSIRSYNPEENFRRIKRQKKLTFIVVEGRDDVPIYESCISSMISEKNDYDVIFSGGKIAIKDFLTKNVTSNAIFIIDKDFNDIGLEDTRLVSLDRYSIENYFICEEVISYSLQFVLNWKLRDVRDAFSLNDYIKSITGSVKTLIKVLFYYQRYLIFQMEGKEKIAWSDFFLCGNNTWELCEIRIEELIKMLTPTDNDLKEAEKYFNDNFVPSKEIVRDFPGKMLKHSLQRYLKQKVVELKPSARGKFNDVERMRELLSAVMHRSNEIKNILAPVISFIENQGTT
jgi:hypothetical protein